MPASITQFSTASSSKVIFEMVKGAIISQIPIVFGTYPTGTFIIDRNINLFYQGQYDAKRLIQAVQTLIVQNQNIIIDSDAITIDSAVGSVLYTIFNNNLA